ncbi:hypothetical protein CCACVL1_14839, partial [Corchorus capsularis]
AMIQVLVEEEEATKEDLSCAHGHGG